MTNYEYYKTEIECFAGGLENFALRDDGVPLDCDELETCYDCIFQNTANCDYEKSEWANRTYNDITYEERLFLNLLNRRYGSEIKKCTSGNGTHVYYRYPKDSDLWIEAKFAYVEFAYLPDNVIFKVEDLI